MANLGSAVLRSAFTSSLLVFGMTSLAFAGDLSRYRDFQLGNSLPTVAKQIGTSPSQAKVVQVRPALIQELAWRPQPLGPSTKTDPAQEVVFSFYAGELFQIVVNYDRYQTEGLTADDFVEAITVKYGIAATPTGPSKAAQGPYGDEEEIIARWDNPRYRFELIRSSYGPSFKLRGVLKELEVQAQAAALEAKRLDDQEAPQRDAARVASEAEATKAKLEKARHLNKPNFRP